MGIDERLRVLRAKTKKLSKDEEDINKIPMRKMKKTTPNRKEFDKRYDF